MQSGDLRAQGDLGSDDDADDPLDISTRHIGTVPQTAAPSRLTSRVTSAQRLGASRSGSPPSGATARHFGGSPSRIACSRRPAFRLLECTFLVTKAPQRVGSRITRRIKLRSAWAPLPGHYRGTARKRLTSARAGATRGRASHSAWGWRCTATARRGNPDGAARGFIRQPSRPSTPVPTARPQRQRRSQVNNTVTTAHASTRTRLAHTRAPQSAGPRPKGPGSVSAGRGLCNNADTVAATGVATTRTKRNALRWSEQIQETRGLGASVAPDKCLYIIASGRVTLFWRERRDTARKTVAVPCRAATTGPQTA